MNPTSFLQLLQGPFNFLRPDPEEIRLLMPDLQRVLPMPRPIFLEDESATPLQGFPVLLSPGALDLRNALREVIESDEALQVASLRRESYDPRLHSQAWDRYVTLLSRAVENATISSYGRQYPAVFWLQHSLDMARLLKDVPKRILRRDSELGRRHGDAIKYRILDRFLDRVLSTTYDLVQHVAGATEEVEEELFPRLLNRMRDNVLLFTEDYIGRDLAELSSYFTGALRIDSRDIRKRLDELARWHADQLAGSAGLRAAVQHLLKADPRTAGRELLVRPGYVAYLASLPGYDPARLLTPPLIQVWENLLLKLKEFELIHSLRRLIVPIQMRDGHLVACELPPARAGGRGDLRLSSATRPLDFLEPWVVDPRVERYGMIYDISDFSQTLSMLHRAGNASQDGAFLTMFRFQRRINSLALAHRAKLEKYLGDGAFYSSREATNLLLCSVHIQRYYVEAVREGLPFDRGMRIALNYGPYRLIPMGGRPGEGDRYEFFGPGLVELSRLTTGKATQEIDEVKTMLVNQGYPETAVQRFFAPLGDKNVDVVDKREESRTFYAYINRNGTLHNNGMVATGPFIAQLDREVADPRLYRIREGERSYVVLTLQDGKEPMPVGIRKLGMAHLKGLEKLAVYEIIDAAGVDLEGLEEVQGERLIAAIEREFANRGTGAIPAVV
jgi:class 3 adenylate cyclase